MIEEKSFECFMLSRYKKWGEGIGKKIRENKASLEDIEENKLNPLRYLVDKNF